MTLDAATIARGLLAYYSSLFPRSYSKCGRDYLTLKDYVEQTEQVGSVLSLDVELGGWPPDKPIGTLAFVNCTCGSTISLTTDGLPLEQGHAVLAWIKSESERRNVKPAVIFDETRNKVRRLAQSSS